MKRLQTKFHAHAMCDSQDIRWKISQNLSLAKNLSFGDIYVAGNFFLFFDIFLKLQQQILIFFCKFSCILQ